MGNDILSFWDILGPIFYLPIIFLSAFRIKNKNESKNPIYKYYTKGLIAKIAGAIIFCLIYALYYKGGDTVNYYKSCIAMNNLMTYNFSQYFDLMTGGRYWYFDEYTGLPEKYMYDDPETFFIVLLANPLVFLGFKSFLTSSILIAWVSYSAVWKFYTMYTELYPKMAKQLSYAILFMPSPLFWGSGIAKDTFAYFSALWLVVNFYKIFIKREKLVINIIMSIINIYILIKIKPYIVISILPILIIWVLYYPISKIKNQFLKFVTAPAILVVGMLLGGTALNMMSGSLGRYSSYDKIITKAQITQADHLREEAYGSNNYNIGTYDGSLRRMIRVGPLAIITALYRPFIFEANNVLMLISGLENTFLLILTIMTIFKAGIVKAFNRAVSEPLLLVSILFTIIFSYGIGISAANFGALVRFKIPLIPFFTSAIFIMMEKHRLEKEIQEQKQKEIEEALASKRAKIPGFTNKRFKL